LVRRFEDHSAFRSMPRDRLGGLSVLCLTLLSGLALLPGVGSARRLTYHEAFVAQGAREILDSGNWANPSIGGLPWLEKPPLPWWLVAALGHCVGHVNEAVARLPSAIAATVLVLGVAVVPTRHYGAGIGLLAGAVQVTTFWTVIREADSRRLAFC
jgi:4-amino-4-deoxy-L-arabinose transferase-like glycosyltransferase